EADAQRLHLLEIPVPEPGPVGDVNLRPELAHAAGDQVRVAVQVVARFERGQSALVFTGKAAQVFGHALEDGLEDVADPSAVRLGQGRVGREAFGQAREQGALGLEGLDVAGGGDHGGEPARDDLVELGAEGDEVGDSLPAVDQPRVGDRVGRAG